MFAPLLVIALAAAAPAAAPAPDARAPLGQRAADSTLTGRVIDAATGAPVPGGAVHVIG